MKFRKNFKLFIIILVIIFLISCLYFKFNYNDMTYVTSNIDNSYYLVRNIPDKQQAANTLAKIKQNIIKLSDYLYQNMSHEKMKPFGEYIVRLHDKVHNIIIIESTQDSIYTSYSINKGEQIIFCLRSRRLENSLHDLNLMMYVALHEISHVACPIYDNHGPLFQKIFAFIIENASIINVYNKVNYRETPEEYCGIVISDEVKK